MLCISRLIISYQCRSLFWALEVMNALMVKELEISIGWWSSCLSNPLTVYIVRILVQGTKLCSWWATENCSSKQICLFAFCCSTAIMLRAWSVSGFHGYFLYQSWKMHPLVLTQSCQTPWDCFCRRQTSLETTLKMSFRVDIFGHGR